MEDTKLHLFRVFGYAKSGGSLVKRLDWVVLAANEEAALSLVQNTNTAATMAIDDFICRELGVVDEARVVARIYGGTSG